MTYKAVYARYHDAIIEDCPTLNNAIAVLQIGAEFGELYAYGIYDTENNSVHLPSTRRVEDGMAEMVKKLSLSSPPAFAGFFEAFPPDSAAEEAAP